MISLSRQSHSLKTWVAGIFAAVVLGACGGGGGDSGTPVLGGGSGGTTTPVAADLVVSLSSASLPSDGSRAGLVTATAVDSKRNALKDVPVSISVDSGAIATPSGKVTDDVGVVTAGISIGSDATKRTITVTVSSGSISKTAAIEVVDPSVSGTGPTAQIDLSTSSVTALVPATVSVTIRSAAGTAVSGVVVNMATVRGGLAVISADSALTDASGVARVTLKPGVTGVSGADEITASAVVAGTQITASKAFSVTGALPTLSIAADSTTLRTSTGATPIRVVLRDEKGSAITGQLVRFSSTLGNVVFSSTSATTDGTGTAQTLVSPRDGSVNGADTVQAVSSYASQDLTGTVGVQIVGEKPQIAVSLSNSAISTSQTATVSVLVRDVKGALAPNSIVSFSTQNGLLTFDASTARTDAAGVARVVASPALATTKGGDIIEARVTIGGVTVADSQAVQISPTVASGNPTLQLSLSSTSLSSASPAVVTATLLDAQGVGVSGQVVAFTSSRGLGKTNVATALTNASGVAVVQLSPSSSLSAGADEVVADARYAGVSLQASKGFQVQATNVTLDGITALSNPLSAYGQTPVTVALTGASVDAPVKVTVTSSCVSQGKATLSPSNFTTTTNSFTMQYRDNGCGALQAADQLQAVIDGTASSRTIQLAIAAPGVSSLAFIQATPEVIYLKGSGFTENSVVTFEVRDSAGNPLPGRVVELRLVTGAGGVTMEGRGVESVNPLSASPFTQNSDAQGRVSARINSGSLPTPVRVHAKLVGADIATVSSNLSVAVGLPSQLNFSLSQGSINIEGYSIDGTSNTYQIIASDRSGNPVPAGTSVNFVTEGGQIEAVKQLQTVSGISRATANFASSEPRPADGRITVVAYALGEESFLDQNGNNLRDASEPFQDLGNIFKDRNFDGGYDPSLDEFVPLTINNGSTCDIAGTAAERALLSINASIPSIPGTCSGTWSGAGQVYVRRAVETVISTSSSRPLWPLDLPVGLSGTLAPISLRTTGNATPTSSFTPMGGVICRNASTIPFNFLVGDANPIRLNPMAAGTQVSVSTSSQGASVGMLGGDVVPSTSEVSTAGAAVVFTTGTEALVVVRFASPSGVTSSTTLVVRRDASCP